MFSALMLFNKHTRRLEKPHEFSNLWAAFRAVFVSHLVVLLVIGTAGDELPRSQSLLVVSAASVVGLSLVYEFYLRKALGVSSVPIILSAFILKTGVGILHYCYFLQPDYFAGFGDYSYLWDYQWMHEVMRYAADYWRLNGLSALPEEYYLSNMNPFLYGYIALLYYLGGGANHLNIAPWNALHSVYVAILISALALRIGADKRQARIALILAAFQPFGFISSLMWRDSIGQFMLVFGYVLLTACQPIVVIWAVALAISCYLAWSVRQPYLIVMLATGVYLYATNTRLSKARVIMGTILVTIIAVITTAGGASILLDAAFSRFWDNQLHLFSPITFFVRFIRGLGGPFPWYQVFMGVNGAEYMPADFFQALYNLAVFIQVIPLAIRSFNKEKRIDATMLLAVLLFLSGIQATGVHMSYVSIGTVFLLPIACQAEPRKWAPTFFALFSLALTANLLYWSLGLTGGNILQSITGY